MKEFKRVQQHFFLIGEAKGVNSQGDHSGALAELRKVGNENRELDDHSDESAAAGSKSCHQTSPSFVVSKQADLHDDRDVIFAENARCVFAPSPRLALVSRTVDLRYQLV